MKIITLILMLVSMSSSAQEIVFEGTPIKRIVLEEENDPTTRLLSKSEQIEYKVNIIKSGDSYYWASRENVQMRSEVSGFYITFLAVNGSGYVRTLTSLGLELFKLLPKLEQKKAIYIC